MYYTYVFVLNACVKNMSQITIQCCLVASESTRRDLWKLMAEQNTPLINELLMQISQHKDFQTWRSQGKFPTSIVSQLCQPLKTDLSFIGQPSRFYTSAINLVSYIYKSWFKLQQSIARKLEGQIRWLSILKSDEELIQQSNSSLEKIRTKATKILASNTTDKPSDDSQKKTENKQKIRSKLIVKTIRCLRSQ
jgi:hypothetical protein